MVLQGMALWAVPAPCWRSAEWGLPLGFKGISGKKTWQEKIPFECRIFLCHGEWTQGIMMLLTKINTDNIMGYIQWSNATLIATMYNVWVCRLSIFMVYTMVLTLEITILIGKMIVNHWILWVPYSGKGATDSSITLPRCLWIVDAPFDWRMSQPKGMNHTPLYQTNCQFEVHDHRLSWIITTLWMVYQMLSPYVDSIESTTLTFDWHFAVGLLAIKWEHRLASHEILPSQEESLQRWPSKHSWGDYPFGKEGWIPIINPEPSIFCGC